MNFLSLIPFLIVFPFAVSFLMIITTSDMIRKIIVIASAVILSASSLLLFKIHVADKIIFYDFKMDNFGKYIFIGDFILALIVFIIGLKHKKYLIILFSSMQIVVMTVFEKFFAHGAVADHNLFIDSFSLIIALIVGLIGSFIAVYALGYMKDFHDTYHKEIKDRRRFFFFIIFAFLGSMFGIVFSNNMMLMFFFWEITTLSSYFLIGYKQNEESKNNALRALWMNLLGGFVFYIGIIFLHQNAKTIELDKALASAKALVLIPAICISFAGMVKSAQLPFSSWLLGAMVAPTPVSALLHSATMVKAGVYTTLRFASVLHNTIAGMIIAGIGGITFLLCSLIAITQSDAKKVLAYSTIANLGLIILCAGIGTYESVWAGILLIIFHAISKSLLFLCVGIVEHKNHDRDIERMGGLVLQLPKLTSMMLLGMAGMFLAPFGMLISKWAVLKAVIDANPLFIVLIIYGSAATLVFWVKWMGKLLQIIKEKKYNEDNISLTVWIPLYILSAFTIVSCLFFPLISSKLIDPYLMEVYKTIVIMDNGNIIIMISMLGLLMLFPFSMLTYNRKVKYVDPYLSAANANTDTSYTGAFGETREIELKNYYLSSYFEENKCLKTGYYISAFLLVSLAVSAVLLKYFNFL